MKKSPKYEVPQDAVEHLRKNGCVVQLQDGVVTVTGHPGLKLLGAVDYLRKTQYVKLDNSGPIRSK